MVGKFVWFVFLFIYVFSPKLSLAFHSSEWCHLGRQMCFTAFNLSRNSHRMYLTLHRTTHRRDGWNIYFLEILSVISNLFFWKERKNISIKIRNCIWYKKNEILSLSHIVVLVMGALLFSSESSGGDATLR